MVVVPIRVYGAEAWTAGKAGNGPDYTDAAACYVCTWCILP